MSGTKANTRDGFAHDPTWFARKEGLDRKLKRHHITSIGFSGCVGIGLMVTSSEYIAISGAPGALISYVYAGLVIISVMRCLAELVSVRPVSGALIDYPHTFVDPALGFAVAVMYWAAQCASMATLTAAAVRLVDQYSDQESLGKDSKAGITVGLCFITLISNICGVKLYGRLERVIKWFKILLLAMLCILMILVRAGIRSNEKALPPHQRDFSFPLSLNFTRGSLTNSSGTIADEIAVPGQAGKFLGIWTSSAFAMFSTMGAELIIVTAGESKSPRKDLPTAARFMYLVPVGFYLLGMILVGLNVNYSDPALYNIWESNTAPKQVSPFLVALSYTSIQGLPDFLNTCFIISAYTAANTALYVASRTLFSLSKKYGNSFIKNSIGRTNNGNTPILAILICSALSLLALLGIGISNPSEVDQVTRALPAFYTSSMCCVYGSECIAFLRFKHGLNELEKRSLFSRDSEDYSRRHYRAHWQPLWAYIGLVGCIIVVLFNDWSSIYLVGIRDSLRAGTNLKPKSVLVGDIAGAYSGPFIFFSLYLGYKLIYGTSIQHYGDFQGAYFLKEFDDDEYPSKKGKHEARWRYILRETWSLIK